jgi:hypothetical protein
VASLAQELTFIQLLSDLLPFVADDLTDGILFSLRIDVIELEILDR